MYRIQAEQLVTEMYYLNKRVRLPVVYTAIPTFSGEVVTNWRVQEINTATKLTRWIN